MQRQGLKPWRSSKVQCPNENELICSISMHSCRPRVFAKHVGRFKPYFLQHVADATGLLAKKNTQGIIEENLCISIDMDEIGPFVHIKYRYEVHMGKIHYNTYPREDSDVITIVLLVLRTKKSSSL